MKNFTGLFIEGTRSGYAPGQCNETFTIDQLLEKLEELKAEHGGDVPIYLYNDNGYTYGHINDDTMNMGDYTEIDGVNFDDYE